MFRVTEAQLIEQLQAELSKWRVWAHLRLERGGDPLGDDTEMRATIGDLIDRYEP